MIFSHPVASGITTDKMILVKIEIPTKVPKLLKEVFHQEGHSPYTINGRINIQSISNLKNGVSEKNRTSECFN